MTGSHGGHNVDSNELAQYVAGRPSGMLMVTEHHDLDRQYRYRSFMVIQHDNDMFANHQPQHQFLMHMIGPQAVLWIGDYVAHA